MANCIIFDCDGTLVDSESLFNRALSVKLNERGIKLSAPTLVKRFRGVQLTTVISTLSNEYNTELNSQFVDEYRLLVTSYFKKELTACDGVAETLSQLNNAMCVASNGPLAKMQMALTLTHLEHFFNGKLFSAFDVNSWKPAPDLFLHAAKEMKFKPEHCLVVEDSIVGIDAALAAGMVPVLYDPKSVHNLIDDVQKITHFSELLALV